MQTLKRVDMTEAEKQALETAVAAVGDILARFETANPDAKRANVALAVLREPDYDADYPWPVKTVARCTFDIEGGRRCSAASLPEALDEIFAKTESERARELAGKYRAEAEKLEKQAAEMEMAEGGGQKTEGGGRKAEDGAAEARPETGDGREEGGAE